MAIIKYEGTDITSRVTVNGCVWEAVEEGRVPQLRVEFDDDDNLWDSWGPKAGDRISVSEKGAAATGAMYVRECVPEAGGYVIRADALPKGDAPALRSWESTTFRTVVKQLASALGLTVKFHGGSDMVYQYVEQASEGALPVIARLCAYAGCIFDVYDGVMHVCARSWVEAQPSNGTVEVDNSGGYQYKSRRVYTGCSLTQTAIRRKRKQIAASTGNSRRMLAIELDHRIGFAGSSALNRACSGILACVNARQSCGCERLDELSPYTPGSIVTVACEGSPSLSGKAVVTKVRNDFVHGKAKVWWRQL